MNNQPIFILGAPRSGTTFLASLLENTPYGSPFETQFFIKYHRRLSLYGDITKENNLDKLLKDILSERAVMQWKLKISASSLINELADNFSYSDLINLICLKAANNNNRLNWGDKTPHYLGDIDTLTNLFPKAKYIYIVRDGRDVALSLLQKDWGPNNIYYCAHYWKNLNDKDHHLDILEKNNQLFSVRYEDLIDNTNTITKSLYEYLELDIHSNDLAKKNKTTIKGNYGKWRHSLSAHQIKIFESIAADTLTKHDYETSWKQAKINPLFVFYYKVHHLLFRAKHLFIINIVDGIKIRFFNKEPFAE